MLLVMEVKVFPQAMTSSHSQKKVANLRFAALKDMMEHESMLSCDWNACQMDF